MARRHPNDLDIQAAEVRTPSECELSASFEFEPGIAATEGKEPKLPRFSMLANTGEPMKLRGFFDPVIVDIKGASFAKDKTPIIMDHDVRARIGHTDSQVISKTNNTIKVAGPVSSVSAAAKEFVADAANGFPFESSIGATIKKLIFVPEGKSMLVNGKMWEGPLNVAAKTVIREVTTTVLGADGKTETKVAASKQGNTMNFETWVASLGLTLSELLEDTVNKLKAQYASIEASLNTDPPPKKGKKGAKKPEVEASEEEEVVDPIQAHREALALTTEKVGAFDRISAQYQDSFPEKMSYTHTDGKAVEYKSIAEFKASAIRFDMTPDAFELQLMRCSRATKTNQPGVYDHDSTLESSVIEARICRAYGLQSGRDRWIAPCGGDPRAKGPIPASCQGREFGLEAYYKSEVLEKSHESKYDGIESIQNLLELQIRAAGKGWHGLNRHGTDFEAAAVDAWTTVRASGFSTINVTNILQNIMHKFALAAFDSQEQTWRVITTRKSLSDFRPHNMYRLNYQGHFRQVDQQGQLKHISLTDSKYAVQADTFGAMITIDRKTIRNDDLGMIVAKCTALGMLGALRIEQNVYTLLLSNPGAFFSSTLGNLISGASSALSQTGASTPAVPAGLDKARRAFRNQVINGYPIGISPRYILGGTSMETQMYQIWKQETFAVAGTSGAISWNLNNNEFQGMYRPVVSPYLNNTSLTDDNGNAISGQSDTQWYLFCDPGLPQGGALVIGFLDGRDQPFFDQADTQFNVPGGIQFRAYLDWGTAMNVYQLALKSAGA